MNILHQINKLSNERQRLYLIAGHNRGMNKAQRNRLYEINSLLRQLWFQHTTCANPFCPCRRNGEYGAAHNGRQRGRVKAMDATRPR